MSRKSNILIMIECIFSMLSFVACTNQQTIDYGKIKPGYEDKADYLDFVRSQKGLAQTFVKWEDVVFDSEEEDEEEHIHQLDYENNWIIEVYPDGTFLTVTEYKCECYNVVKRVFEITDEVNR